MELAIALILFAGLVVCWLVLPGSVAATPTRYEAEPTGPATVQQPA